MKISEFLSKQKEELPFFLYCGTGKGYKIPCFQCQFFSQNKLGFWHCNSMFLSGCQNEFADWCSSKMEIK